MRTPNEMNDHDRPQTIIALNNLHKKHGDTVALCGLSLTVPRGSIFALLGPNGSGKTTTLKLLLGMARADSGQGHVFGLRIDNEKDSVAIRQRTGFVSETKELFQQLDVETTIGMVRGFYPKWKHETEHRLLSEFALPLKQRVSALSKGLRAQLALLVACSRDAELLILDEPTDGLDPASAEQLLKTLVGMVAESGVTVFLSSHQLHEVERVADGVAIMHEGRVVLQGELDELRGSVRRIDVKRHTTNDDSKSVDWSQFIPDGTLLLHSNGPDNHHSLMVRGNAELVEQNVQEFFRVRHSNEDIDINVHPVAPRELFLTLTDAMH